MGTLGRCAGQKIQRIFNIHKAKYSQIFFDRLINIYILKQFFSQDRQNQLLSYIDLGVYRNVWTTGNAPTYPIWAEQLFQNVNIEKRVSIFFFIYLKNPLYSLSRTNVAVVIFV